VNHGFTLAHIYEKPNKIGSIFYILLTFSRECPLLTTRILVAQSSPLATLGGGAYWVSPTTLPYDGSLPFNKRGQFLSNNIFSLILIKI
jgi:hypothetical protein